MKPGSVLLYLWVSPRWSPARLISLCFGLIFLTSCGLNEHRYELTAEVEADGVTYVGSTVQKFYCQDGGGAFGSLQVGYCRVEGEAVVVNIGNRGTLFVLMRDGRVDPETGQRHMGSPADMLGQLGLIPQADKSYLPPEITNDRLPAMITFKDLNKASTVEQVDPANLSARFGQNVHFKRLSVTPTYSKVTYGKVAAMLPWFDSLNPDANLKGSTTRFTSDHSLAGHIDASALKRKYGA